MPLVKIRNTSKTIVFVDSINLSIRPYRSINDVVLISEDQANSDAQLAKCFLTGVLEKCAINENFEKPQIKREVVNEVPKIENIKNEKEVKNDEKEVKNDVKEEKILKTKKASKKAKVNKKDADKFVKEPKSRKSVVFAGLDANGEVITREASVLVQAEAPMPDFIDPNEVSNLKAEDIDQELMGTKDIIYADMK